MAQFRFYYTKLDSPCAISVNNVITGHLTPQEQQVVAVLRGNNVNIQVLDKQTGLLIKEGSFNYVCNWLYQRSIKESTRTTNSRTSQAIFLEPIDPPEPFGK